LLTKLISSVRKFSEKLVQKHWKVKQSVDLC